MFEIPPQKLIYCYNQFQPLFDNMEQTIPNLLLYQGLLSRDQIEEWTETVKHKVLILDDLMTQVAKSKETVAVCCITAHHKDCTVLSFFHKIYFVNLRIRCLSLLSLRRFIKIFKRLETNIVLWSPRLLRSILIF